MAAPALIREKSLRALPALVSSAYAAAVAGGHVIFSETELAVVRTGAGVPVCMSFIFFSLLCVVLFLCLFLLFLVFQARFLETLLN